VAGPSSSAGRLSARWFWVAFVGLYLVVALPILWVELPPSVDYPNHLARMHVLIEQPRSATLQQFYEIHWRPLPNLAMDLTVPLLAGIMPLEWAGKAFVLACFALLPASAAWLHRVATGQWSIWPLFAFVLLYTHLFLWGFLNYLFGLGLAVTSFALWLALARHSAVLRAVVASICALVLFFAHLAACVVFGLLIAGHELGEIWRHRDVDPRRILARVVLGGLPFLIPMAILFGSGLGAELGDISYANFVRKFGALAMFEGHLALDIATVVALLSLIAIAYLKRMVTVVPALRGPLLLLLIVHFVSPTNLMTAHGIDERLPMAFGLVLAAGTMSTGATMRSIRAAALAGLALFLVRMTIVAADCAEANRVYPRLIAMLDQVPRGGRLAVAFDSNVIAPGGLPTSHLPTLAVLRRDAFVTTLFAYETQQPVTLTPAALELREAAEPRALWQSLMAGPAGEERVRAALAGFDALVVLSPTPFVVPANPLLLPVGIEPDFALYRVVP